MGKKETNKWGNNAFSKKIEFEMSISSLNISFGFQKMTMDVGSPMSRCSKTPTKFRLQKVLFPLLGVDELILSLDIDDDSVMKHLNQLKF
jgi:hypothetical protein